MEAVWTFFSSDLYGPEPASLLLLLGARRSSQFPEEILSDRNSEEFLTLGEHEQELHRFFDRVRTAGRIVVKTGEHEFVVEHRRATVTDEARRLLARGGPEG